MHAPAEHQPERFLVGDRVRLSRRVGCTASGTGGKVLGFLRRDLELLVISLDSDGVLEVLPQDVVKEADGAVG